MEFVGRFLIYLSDLSYDNDIVLLVPFPNVELEKQSPEQEEKRNRHPETVVS